MEIEYIEESVLKENGWRCDGLIFLSYLPEFRVELSLYLHISKPYIRADFGSGAVFQGHREKAIVYELDVDMLKSGGIKYINGLVKMIEKKVRGVT